MTTLTIRNIDNATKRLLRLRAARHDRSMEEEVRQILRAALHAKPAAEQSLGNLLMELSRPGVELPDVRSRTPHEPVAL